MSRARNDIIIVGSGIAGFAAAMGAAESSSHVIVLEQEAAPGGNSTLANVGTVCGAYYQIEEEFKAVGYPFTQAFVTTLMERSGTKPMTHAGLVIVPYEWSVLQTLMKDQLKSKAVSLWSNATVTDAVLDQDAIDLVVSKDGDERSLRPHAIVDCSGRGVVPAMLGFDMLTEDSYQAASQIFRVRGVAPGNEYSLGMALKRATLQFREASPADDFFPAWDIIPGSLRNGSVDIKLTLPDVINDDLHRHEIIREGALQRIRELFPLLTTSIAYLKDARIDRIFPQLGVRVMQRPRGKAVLDEEDIMSNRRFDDAIAIGTWPMETWDYQGNVQIKSPDGFEGFEIPARCLQTNASERLFFAGKCISASTQAISSARVMGTALQTGYAAGRLAVGNPGTEREQILRSLTTTLRQASQ